MPLTLYTWMMGKLSWCVIKGWWWTHWQHISVIHYCSNTIQLIQLYFSLILYMPTLFFFFFFAIIQQVFTYRAPCLQSKWHILGASLVLFIQLLSAFGGNMLSSHRALLRALAPSTPNWRRCRSYSTFEFIQEMVPYIIITSDSMSPTWEPISWKSILCPQQILI